MTLTHNEISKNTGNHNSRNAPYRMSWRGMKSTIQGARGFRPV
jgi:hypothetical protein